VTQHRWAFGDGSTSSMEDPGSHTFFNAGTYVVTYRVWDDAGAMSLSQQRTITVQSTDTQPPPTSDHPPQAVYFSTDWADQLGTSQSALTDGGRWSSGAGNWLNSMEVVRAPAGFPTTNVLQQRGIAESGSWGQMNLMAGAVPQLQVGDSLGMRVYWQSPNPYYDVDNLLHGFEVLDPGNDPIGINSEYRANAWQITIDLTAVGGGVYGDRGSDGWGAFALRPDGVYMLEILLVRVGSSQVHVEVKLSDAGTGAMVYDVDEWPSYLDPNLAAMHTRASYSTSGSAWSNLREWRIGINGIGSVDGQVVHRWGAFALCSSWCGPYPISGVEGG
jgi:PKD repeat protein